MISKDALHSLRLGELKLAISDVVADAVAMVSKNMPIYSEVLKMQMDTRRMCLVVALKEVAKRLEEDAASLQG